MRAGVLRGLFQIEMWFCRVGYAGVFCVGRLFLPANVGRFPGARVSTNLVDLLMKILVFIWSNQRIGIRRCGKTGRYNNLSERRKESELR